VNVLVTRDLLISCWRIRFGKLRTHGFQQTDVGRV